MKRIIEELNLENGSKYKITVLEKHKDNELLKRVLKMTYDKVTFTYGITMKNVQIPNGHKNSLGLNDALDVLENNFCTRKTTGNQALELLHNILMELSEDDAEILIKIINRDLRINLGKTQINKVFKNLIVKPPYMRCSTYNEKTAKKISFKNKAIIQLKADGSYRAITVDSGDVTITSRSGEVEDGLLHIVNEFKSLPDGVYIGELLVKGETNRALANGIINSDNEEAKLRVYVQLWDYITLDEYSRGKDKKNKTVYLNRWVKLNEIITDAIIKNNIIQLIPTHYVDSIHEALKYTSEWMSEGYEGAILKDLDNIFLDHTSPTQLKLKLEVSIEVRCTGFTEGKAGTKRVNTFGAMVFETDDKLIKGQCSGFTDKLLEEFNSKRDELIGKVFEVQFNDLTKGRDNDYYALSHPRFIEFRNDKDSTDTLETAQENVKMAMELL